MAKGKQLNGHLLHSVAEPCSLRHLDAVGLGVAISVSSTFSVCFLESRMTATGCGFNRWMQQIGEIVQRVFRSLVFSLGDHSTFLLLH